MEVTFEHLSGSRKGQVERIHAERITIGRNPDNLLAFDPQKDLDVSGAHATLSDVEGGRLLLTDLGSSNGTLLNGKPLAGSTIIESGWRIRFGANGPEVRVTFVASARKPAGATREMLASAQQQLVRERAASGRRLAIAVGVVAVVGALGFGGFAVVTSAFATKRSAAEAKALAEDAAARARKKHAGAAAPEEMRRAEDAEKDALALFEKGDLRGAEARFKEARALFLRAQDVADLAAIDAILKAREEEERRSAADAARRMAEERQAYETREAELEEKHRAELLRLAAQGRPAPAAAPSVSSAEVVRGIVRDAAPSIVLVHAESYFQPPGQEKRTRLAVVEATGFAVAKDVIATAKHVLQPWKYDARLLATTRKLKQEQGFEVRDYVEVSVRTASGGWEKRYDSISGSCAVLALAPDRFEAKAQAVQIDWNSEPTVVPDVTVHERGADDLALLRIPGGALAPVRLADGPPEEHDGVVALGTVRAAEASLVSLSPLRSEVQARTEAVFTSNATAPASFAGAPVFGIDGSVCGIVVGTEAQSLTCDPAPAIKKLLPGRR